MSPLPWSAPYLGVSHSTLTGAFGTIRQLVAAQGASFLGRGA